ncbi:transcriptional regulator, LysR family [Salegentibacter echinorum]|uniref:Transcriptional regulator, LysR family n=1 Tax=Salegentibacter echinorum TaxID=1073325 RepID=A0A1M5BGD4_SALEC|nr:LysR family transcriptional regulator [Salegentibacter echinorum]SHF41604.1 transcriptional regulator, LysR family [Salegentibacter echinorum]
MSNQIEFRHLRYFLAVAEDLHFRKAAEKLYISQPGLSRQIKQMEDDLGIQLFERHNRKVKLTHVGEYFKHEITKNLKNLNLIINHAKLLQNGKEGSLTIGYVGSAIQKIIPELLLKFKRISPNINFVLKEMDNQKQVENLLLQNIDIGFIRLERVPTGLSLRSVLLETFCLVLPKDHPIDSSNYKNLSQFKDEFFILFDPKFSPSYFEKIMQIFDDNDFIPKVSHSSIHANSIFKLIENNFGISIIPKSLQIPYYENVKFIELVDIPQRTTLSVVWDRKNTNPILDDFLELL